MEARGRLLTLMEPKGLFFCTFRGTVTRRWTRMDGHGRGNGGAEGDRTLDLRIANATLSQLSYRPTARRAILASGLGRSNQVLFP